MTATATFDVRFNLPAADRTRILSTAETLLADGVPSADVHRSAACPSEDIPTDTGGSTIARARMWSGGERALSRTSA